MGSGHVERTLRTRRMRSSPYVAGRHKAVFDCTKTPYQGRRNVFSFGGAKTKKGTVMSKRAPTVYMQIIITNALMKHYYRHIRFLFTCLAKIFSWGKLNKRFFPHTHTKFDIITLRA